MARASEFLNHLLDLLRPLGDVTARSMFGGWGIYRGGKMFALVAFETFYVKVDAETRPEFETLDLAPFTYESSGGKKAVMAYYTVPTEALDSSPLLCHWAEKGIAAAQRAASGKKGSRKKTK